MSKVAVITGGSSGIGFCTAVSLRDRGYHVYELSRRDSKTENICHIRTDVTDEAQVRATVGEVMQREGHIDVLINNAGFGISGAVEFTSAEDARRLMDVNFFGLDNMVRAVLPIMRKAGAGRIINLSSVAAPIPIPFQTYYSVSKAAINAFTMALANEVREFGVEVCAVMPGDIRTGFTAARQKSEAGDDIYHGRIGRSVASMEKDEQNGMAPETAGRFIAYVAGKKKVKPLYAIGIQYKCFVVLARLLPVSLVNFIIGKLYAS